MASHLVSAASCLAAAQSRKAALRLSRWISYLARAVWIRPRCRRSRVIRSACRLNWRTKVFISGMRQEFRQVNGPDPVPLAIEQTLDLHEATRVVGNNVIRARLDGRLAFDLAHRRRDHGKLGGEGPAETAAGLRKVSHD